MKAKIARLMRNGKRDEAMALFDRYMTKRENKKKAFSPIPSLLDGAHRHCSNDDWESYNYNYRHNIEQAAQDGMKADENDLGVLGSGEDETLS